MLISGKETKTPNSKIFKSLESLAEKIVLDKVVIELEKFTKINDYENIIKILKEQVEGYVQENGNRY